MATDQPQTGGLIVRQVEGDVSMQAFCGGQLAVFSQRAPEKDGHNDDAFTWIPAGPHGAVLALADGAGGMPHADDASRVALETLRSTILTAPQMGTTLREAILTGFDAANAAVFRLGGAATTMAVVEMLGEAVRIFHAGDSPVMVVMADGMIKHQTIDHTPLGYAVEAGVFDADEAIHHEARHIISNMVGSPDMRVEMSSQIPIEDGDTLLMSSDGLFDNLYGREIVETICDTALPEAAARLVELATQRMTEYNDGEPSKPDDLTFALYRRS